MNEKIDVLIVGGGPGGTPAAMALAAAGKKVILVEKGQGLGGTCLFEGCIPSKIFRETAHRRRQIKAGTAFGLTVPGETDVDWTAVKTRKTKILNMRSQGAQMKAQGIANLEVVFAKARFLGERSACIETSDGARTVEFDNAIIATGSIANRIPVPGADLAGVIDAGELIATPTIPESLTIIGGGPIGVEMGQIFHELGSKITIIEMAERILMPVDGVLATRLEDIMRRDGIALHTNCRVVDICQEKGVLSVQYSDAQGKVASAIGEKVLVVTGRHPNVDGLGLEMTRIGHNEHGIKVSPTLETDEPGIFATGDVIGAPMFAHWATAQALAVAQRILGIPALLPNPDHNSAVIFGFPEIGMVGLTEQAAQARGIDACALEYDFRIDARAQITGDPEGLLRVVYEKGSLKVLGIHCLVENADELMGEAALIVAKEMTLREIISAIHPHPTLSESLSQAILGSGVIKKH